MEQTLFDDIETITDEFDGFPADWHHHGTATGYRYGCRCEPCGVAHGRSSAESAARSGSRRQCRRCGEMYLHVMHSGTGTKYCAKCKLLAYREAVDRHHALATPSSRCVACHAECRPKKGRWPLCGECYRLVPTMFVAALLNHRAPVEFVLAVAKKPTCEVCSVDLTVKVKDTSKGRLRYQFALDHDHACCPGARSCGACLRGLLCMTCNTALGYIKDDAGRARAMAAYLDRVRHAVSRAA